MTDWLLPFVTALAAGVLSSWGVGGGTLLLVAMTLLLGVEQMEAQAINLLFFLPTAGAGLFFHRKNGLLGRQAALPGAAVSLAAALAAAAVDTGLLRKLFGLFLLWSGGTMLLGAFRRPDSGQTEE